MAPFVTTRYRSEFCFNLFARSRLRADAMRNASHVTHNSFRVKNLGSSVLILALSVPVRNSISPWVGFWNLEQPNAYLHLTCVVIQVCIIVCPMLCIAAYWTEYEIACGLRSPVSGVRSPARVLKTSNGHNSATRHPIDFVFGSRLGFFKARIALFNITAHELHELYYDRPTS